MTPLVGDYPQDIHEATAQAAAECEVRRAHDWRLYARGDTVPHYWCPCWGRAEIDDPMPALSTIPLAHWRDYAAGWAATGCDVCTTTRDCCAAPDQHFTGAEIERRRRAILERLNVPP